MQNYNSIMPSSHTNIIQDNKKTNEQKLMRENNSDNQAKAHLVSNQDFSQITHSVNHKALDSKILDERIYPITGRIVEPKREGHVVDSSILSPESSVIVDTKITEPIREEHTMIGALDYRSHQDNLHDSIHHEHH